MTSLLDSIARVFGLRRSEENYPRRVVRLLKNQDHRGAAKLLASLERNDDAVSVLEQGEQYETAAKFAERFGDFARASLNYERAGQLRLAVETALRGSDQERAALLNERMNASAGSAAPPKQLQAVESAEHWESAVSDMVPSRGEVMRGAELRALRTYAYRAAVAHAAGGSLEKAVHFYEIAGHQTEADMLRRRVPPINMRRLDAARDRMLARIQCDEPGDWRADATAPPAATGPALPKTDTPLGAPALVEQAPKPKDEQTSESESKSESKSKPESEPDSAPEPAPAPAPAPDSAPEPAPQRLTMEVPALRRYDVLEPLPDIPLGQLARTRNNTTDTEFVLHFLPPDVVDGDERKSRFEKIARSLRGLRHESLVSVLGHGIVAGRPCLALELIDAPTLEQRLAAEEPMALSEVLKTTEHVLEGLLHAHSQGVIHGALDASSVRLPTDAKPKLGHLAAGLLFDRASLAEAIPSLAPEFIAGAGPDERGDVYGVGAILQRMLSVASVGDGDAALESVWEDLVRLASECCTDDPDLRPELVVLLARIEGTQWELGEDAETKADQAASPEAGADAEEQQADVEPAAQSGDGAASDTDPGTELAEGADTEPEGTPDEPTGPADRNADDDASETSAEDEAGDVGAQEDQESDGAESTSDGSADTISPADANADTIPPADAAADTIPPTAGGPEAAGEPDAEDGAAGEPEPDGDKAAADPEDGSGAKKKPAPRSSRKKRGRRRKR